MGTYEHITALQSIDVPTLDLVRSLSKVEASSLAGDFVDGMVVSLDLLHKRTAKKKYSKRIILLTDAASEIEGAEDIQQIIDQIKEMDVILQILYVAMCFWGAILTISPVCHCSAVNFSETIDNSQLTEGEEVKVWDYFNFQLMSVCSPP